MVGSPIHPSMMHLGRTCGPVTGSSPAAATPSVVVDGAAPPASSRPTRLRAGGWTRPSPDTPVPTGHDRQITTAARMSRALSANHRAGFGWPAHSACSRQVMALQTGRGRRFGGGGLAT